MKLYVLGVNNNQIDPTEVENHKFKETVSKYIISNEGIYQYTNTTLKKIVIIDFPSKTITVNHNIKLLCDSSKFVTGPDWYQLPITCVEDIIKRTYYRLQPKALVTLVIETNMIYNKIASIYFETSDLQISHGTEEDIVSFLKLLKIY